MDWTQFDAALFDLDGVITPTAELHMRVWGEMFNDFLTERGVTEPYTDDDYFDNVDGRPRYEGVRTFLASRGITLSEDKVRELGDTKDALFNEVLERDGIQAYPGSLALLDALEECGIPKAIVSSSRNARAVLKAAGQLDRFPVIMDGVEATNRGLPGKPNPDTFIAAAADLGANITRCVVIEDATSGVKAGRDGGFGLVVGVDRGAGPDALLEAGAHLVVSDLEELV